MKTLRVREATTADRETLILVNTGLAKETEGKHLDPSTVGAGVDAVVADPGRGFYIVCETDDGSVAGGLMVTTEWSDWRNAWYWWIQSVYVFPAHRRKGVYTMLHRHVEAVARERGDVCGIRLYVDRDNARAQSTYRHLGMTQARYDLYEVDLG